jgi:hypothetical protein
MPTNQSTKLWKMRSSIQGLMGKQLGVTNLLNMLIGKVGL